MKIISIVMDGVGKFGTRSEVTGLGPGVNILAAGNEAGKSTLFRAVRACLFERHNTKSESVRILATDGLSLPVTVSLGFELGDQAYTITKSFLKSPTASLKRGGVEVARGREADDLLWELLGIAPGTTRGVDEAAFGILWVGQKQSFKAPEPTEAATTVLNSAIQAEVGTLVGGDRAQDVLAKLKKDLDLLVTATDKPKAGGPLAQETMRLGVLQTELAAVETRLSILDGQLVALAMKQGERARQADPALLTQMATELDTAQKNQKAGEGAAAKLATFEALEQRSKSILDHKTQALSDLQGRQARIDTNRQRQKDLNDTLGPLDARARTAREVISGTQKEIAEIDAQAQRDDEDGRRLQHLAGIVARANEREALALRRDALLQLGERLVSNAASLTNNRVTAAVLKSLDEMEREISTLTARLEAAAPEVAIELGTAGTGMVSVGDTLLGGNAVQAAVDPLVIRVSDLATITVTPAKAASAADQKKRQDAQERVSRLIADAGVGSASDLRATRARREALEAEALGLRAELKMQGIADASPALAIEDAKTKIQAIDTTVADVLAQMKADHFPTAEDISTQQDGLRLSGEQARRQRQTFGGVIDAQSEILSGLAADRGQLGGTLTEIQNRLDADLARLPDAERPALLTAAFEAVNAATQDHQMAAAALVEQRQSAPSPDELERLQTRVTRLVQALDNHKTGLGTLDREIANLEGQIQNAGGDGLGEKAEEVRQARDLTEREVARYQGRVDTLLLLKETIEACYSEQRDRLHAPLRRHLKPFLNDVFSGAELELGKEFSIAGIKRNGPGSETFDRLSVGTQEQIAVLVRLAMGAMICERGQPVPIILDDALVYSDDDRIEKMFDALDRAGRQQQVIVLTCRMRAFALLGGRQLSITGSAT